MFERLNWYDHQTARRYGHLLAGREESVVPLDEVTDRLRALIRRDYPDLGERFLLPSGQTAGRFEDAIHAWAS